jgi:hypothetical protein
MTTKQEQQFLEGFLRLKDKKKIMSEMLLLIMKAVYLQGKQDGWKEAKTRYGIRTTPKAADK